MAKLKPVKIFFSGYPGWERYEYWYQDANSGRVICSDSLINLKKYAKENATYTPVWINRKTGGLNYGQKIVVSYPYTPRSI